MRLPLSLQTRLEIWGKLLSAAGSASKSTRQRRPGQSAGGGACTRPYGNRRRARALQLQAAEDEAKFREVMQESNEDMSLGHRVLAAAAERQSDETKEAAADAAKHVAAAKDRIDRLERGEDIGGTTKIDLRQLLRSIGIAGSELRHWGNVHRIHELGVEQEYLDAIGPDQRRERRVARKILRAAERGKRARP